MDYSFPKSQRLKSAKRISHIYRKGQKVKQSSLLLFYLEGESAEHKISVAVPKRKVPKAVHRNRIKRILREVYRLNKTKLAATKGFDFILMYLGSDLPDQRKLEQAFIKLCEKWRNSSGV
ncbi:MAG: ribonuclease P protein component [Croceimicrobium sp.]